MASGLSGSNKISALHSPEATQLQTCLDAVCLNVNFYLKVDILVHSFLILLLRVLRDLQVMQGLAKSIAWDGEGATCLVEVSKNNVKRFIHEFPVYL